MQFAIDIDDAGEIGHVLLQVVDLGDSQTAVFGYAGNIALKLNRRVCKDLVERSCQIVAFGRGQMIDVDHELAAFEGGILCNRLGHVADDVAREEFRENVLHRFGLSRFKTDHIETDGFSNGFREDVRIFGREFTAGNREFAFFGQTDSVGRDAAGGERKVGVARDASEIDISSCHRRCVGSERIANKRAAVELQSRIGKPIVGHFNRTRCLGIDHVFGLGKRRDGKTARVDNRVRCKRVYSGVYGFRDGQRLHALQRSC